MSDEEEQPVPLSPGSQISIEACTDADDMAPQFPCREQGCFLLFTTHGARQSHVRSNHQQTVSILRNNENEGTEFQRNADGYFVCVCNKGFKRPDTLAKHLKRSCPVDNHRSTQNIRITHQPVVPHGNDITDIDAPNCFTIAFNNVLKHPLCTNCHELLGRTPQAVISHFKTSSKHGRITITAADIVGISCALEDHLEPPLPSLVEYQTGQITNALKIPIQGLRFFVGFKCNICESQGQAYYVCEGVAALVD